MRGKVLLASALLAGAALVTTSAPAMAATQNPSCGPAISTSGKSGSLIRNGFIATRNGDGVTVDLYRGTWNGAAYGGIWFARIKARTYASSISKGDVIQLRWTDYDPRDQYNYCQRQVAEGGVYATTPGVNWTYSSGNQWGRRLMAAYGKARNSSGTYSTAWADWNVPDQRDDSPWVVSY